MEKVLLSFQEIYQKKQMKLVRFGLTIAFAGAMFNCIFQNFNVAATRQIEGGFSSGLMAAFVMSILTLGICEFLGGVMTLLWNIIRGVPVAEIGRNWRVKSGRMIIISAILAGPIGTACSVIAVSMCGSTYANCIIGLTPVLAAVLSVVILREKLSGRAWIGIVISIAGAIIACMGAPGDATNFALGIGIACICPLAFALEGIISTHAVDVTDPMLSCPMYRMIASGLIEIVLSIVICLVTGNIAWIGQLFGLITSTPLCLFYLLCTSIAMFIQYNTAYTSFNYCGAAKSEAILWTGTFWTIPVGFVMQALGILPYSVTPMGIIGAIVVVAGILLVVAKPSELFNLRSN
ncbi:MAG: DMT family transporter [Eubacteriaceae bacterium]|jgi:drug/metabolite transporter (DMT)-like permease